MRFFEFLKEQEDDPVKRRKKAEKERKKRQAQTVRRRLERMSDRMEAERDTAARRGLPGFY